MGLYGTGSGFLSPIQKLKPYKFLNLGGKKLKKRLKRFFKKISPAHFYTVKNR